jgi:hypothetical protein
MVKSLISRSLTIPHRCEKRYNQKKGNPQRLRSNNCTEQSTGTNRFGKQHCIQ